MDPVVHFEMPYNDKSRMAEFYQKSFGWKMNMLGAEMNEYVVAHTTETDQDGMIKTPGHINGGFFRRSKPDQAPGVVIAVKDIRAAMERVKASGGTVLGGMKPGEPDEIPGVGLYCSILDSEGNRVGMLQPKGM